MPDPALLLPKLLAVADRAGAVILEHYAGDLEVARKADRSPVTVADEDAERVILEALRELTPDIPVVAEEAVARGEIPSVAGGRFWLVDPLDGTREFISKNGEVTVHVALGEGGKPPLGGVWPVAPREGTREFIWKKGEFRVTVAWVGGEKRLRGVVTAPAKGWAWWGAAGQGASRREDGEVTPIRVRPRPQQGVVAVASR